MEWIHIGSKLIHELECEDWDATLTEESWEGRPNTYEVSFYAGQQRWSFDKKRDALKFLKMTYRAFEFGFKNCFEYCT